jgi:hypothetical protein
MSRSAARCSMKRLVDQHFAGATRQKEERRLREHLPGCEICQGHYRRHQLFAKLAPGALPAEERIARGLGLGGPLQAFRGFGSRLFPAPMALAGVAAACALFFLIRPMISASEFQARGEISAAAVGFWAYRIAGGGEPSELGDSIAPGDELAFAYFNPPGAGSVRYLLVFGVDEHRHVYWYHPAWLDPAATPTAVQVADGRHELGEAVAHELDGKKLTLYALFVEQPLSVRQVEASIQADDALLQNAAWSRLLRVEQAPF